MTNDKAQKIAARIGNKYRARETTELDTLRELDARVKRPAKIFSYVLGSIGALIMGSGMSLIMTDIASKIGLDGKKMLIGTVAGVIGLLISLINYPIHKAILDSRKEKYKGEILTLSDKIISDK